MSVNAYHHDYMTTYPPHTWISIPVGLAFVFLDFGDAELFRSASAVSSCLEIWQGESEDEPKRLPGMAKRWEFIPLFWEAYQTSNRSLLAEVITRTPQGTYGVRTLILHTCIG